MDSLFSCRNCVQNCGQSLLIGKGDGFCLQHDSVLLQPERTTCKYLHRKDFPRFLVDEGLREHASEFAGFSGMADLIDQTVVPRVAYSEKMVWSAKRFDPLNQGLAQYHKTTPKWIFLQAMSGGGGDGRRLLAHASLVRRYMDHCDTWKSFYRFLLALIDELPKSYYFADEDLNVTQGDAGPEFREEARWDVFFNRLSGIQEFGFHAGLEKLRWASDELNGGLADLDWEVLTPDLEAKSQEWVELIIQHATREGAYFVQEERSGDPQEPEFC